MTVTVQEAWKEASSRFPKASEETRISHSSPNRGWITVRVFVSSTMSDFHSERDELVKRVFPDLRKWGESRSIRVIECDLRWGIPQEATVGDAIRMFLAQIDRCRSANESPYFISMLSTRYGWVPPNEAIPPDVKDKYDWVDGFSLTAMEVLHAAFREYNPNALFMFRTSDFKEGLSGVARESLSESPLREQHVETLKSEVRTRYPNQTYDYACEGVETQDGSVKVKGLEDVFAPIVLECFKSRIEEQYPYIADQEIDVATLDRRSHNVFVENRSLLVIGRDQLLNDIRVFLETEDDAGTPLVLVGDPGAGKSSIIAWMSKRLVEEAGQDENMKVFYHFVGAAPGSTDLVRLLMRIHRELAPTVDPPTDTQQVLSSLPSLLQHVVDKGQRIVIFIDALNQLDNHEGALLQWLPPTFPRGVRCVLSTLKGDCYSVLEARDPIPCFLSVGPLDKDSRAIIIRKYLAEYNKELDQQQVDKLLAKEGSQNPLWLSTACEELRVFGKFDEVTEKIEMLSPDLGGLLGQVIDRFEEEEGDLVRAALCLLECSRHGLLETELLGLLGQSSELNPPEEAMDVDLEFKESSDDQQKMQDKLKVEKDAAYRAAYDAGSSETAKVGPIEGGTGSGEKPDQSSDLNEELKVPVRLPMVQWLHVYRTLGTFLRPCGDSGEGRLDFFHRSMSKAVRNKCLTKNLTWWHCRLASYFETTEDVNRRAEELPYHLEKVVDGSRLVRCLVDWNVFAHLTSSEDRKIDLLRYWRTLGGYETAMSCYIAALRACEDEDPLVHADKQIRIGCFLGQIGMWDTAEHLLEKALATEERRLGSDALRVADILMYIAEVREEHRGSKSWNEITIPYKTSKLALLSIKIRRSHHPIDERALAATLFVLGMNISEVGQRGGHAEFPEDTCFAMSVDAGRECFEIRQRIQDPKLGEAAMLLGSPYWAFQRYQEALDAYMEALKIWINQVGEFHLGTARVMSNIGMCLHHGLGRPEEGLMYLNKALNIRRELLGPKHPRTMRSENMFIQCQMAVALIQQHEQHQ